MLDTNMISYLVSGRSQAARKIYLESELYTTIALSVISEAEIRFGLEKRPEATKLRSTFEEFFASVQILPWDSDVAKAYGRLRSAINATGKSLSIMDLLIASHAIASGAVLVSHDQAFHHLKPFLNVVDWAADL
jgi:tRNA(fMet)-specific endonuclease VapC